MSETFSYESPFVQRYASAEMGHVFSTDFRVRSWRKLWVALAKAQQKASLPVSQEQIAELEQHLDDIDFDRAAALEKELRHDVVAHIQAYGEKCPKAKPIIHLGATSAFVTDNGDLLQIRAGLKIIEGKLLQTIRHFAEFANQHRNLACLAYTHLQPAQPTTIGKRACLWLQDFVTDFSDLEHRRGQFRFLGVKGASGTQASLLALCNQDRAKVKAIEEGVATEMGLQPRFLITGQTYARKQDVQILDVLKGIAISAHKFATDLRLLAHLKEIEEPFEAKQVGSSAMPYKRNPMLAERVCSLARFVMSLAENPTYTAALQWLERSLDDSANRRLCIPEAFLATDSILNLLMHISSGLEVNLKNIERHLLQELPFMASENILMACVKRGGDRQVIHERLRQHSQEAQKRVKNEGLPNDLLERILHDRQLGLSQADLGAILDVKHFIGLAPQQVEEFLKTEVEPLLLKYKDIQVEKAALEV